MPYCYCTPSRDLSLTHWVWGVKGTLVSRVRSEAALRGWETRLRNIKARLDAEAAEAALAAQAEPVVFVPFIIDTPTPAPDRVTSTEPVTITLEVGD